MEMLPSSENQQVPELWRRPEAWAGLDQVLLGHSDPLGTHLERHSSLKAWMAMRVMFTDIKQKGNCWNGGS